MAHNKGAYVTDLNEFINSSYQRYHHRKYIQQLQYLLKIHQRTRRCLPDPAQSIHSKQAKRPLPTSPCFQQQQRQATTQHPKFNNISNRPVVYSPPGRSVLISPRSRSSCSRTGLLPSSALSNFNSITCFSSSTRTPTPQPTRKELNIPTVIVTSEGNQLLQFENGANNMAPSSVHQVNRNTTHTDHVAPSTTSATMQPNQTAAPNPTSNLRKVVTFKLPPSSTNNDTLQQQRTRSAPPLYRSISSDQISESSFINCVSIFFFFLKITTLSF